MRSIRLKTTLECVCHHLTIKSLYVLEMYINLLKVQSIYILLQTIIFLIIYCYHNHGYEAVTRRVRFSFFTISVLLIQIYFGNEFGKEFAYIM